MSGEGRTNKERITAVEVELRYTKDAVANLTDVVGETNDGLRELTGIVDNKLQGSFSGREKAMIICAIIMGLFSLANIIVGIVWG